MKNGRAWSTAATANELFYVEGKGASADDANSQTGLVDTGDKRHRRASLRATATGHRRRRPIAGTAVAGFFRLSRARPEFLSACQLHTAVVSRWPADSAGAGDRR